MTKNICRLNDLSDHGGHVITATGFLTIVGINVALDQDLHSCPIHGHGITPITATTSTLQIDGKKIVRTDDRAACGAKIISNQNIMSSD
jgi:uncharacterized Zn-binding protein involved in type VI secretion